MKLLYFFLITNFFTAFAQQTPGEYVVIETKSESFFSSEPAPKLTIPKLVFKDSDRATRRLNAYFSKPVPALLEHSADCRWAYEPSAFDVATRQVMHTIFPEVKW